MATHFSTVAWVIPMDRGLGDYSPWYPEESDMTERLSTAQQGSHIRTAHQFHLFSSKLRLLVMTA